MSMELQIQQDIKAAMLAKEKTRLESLRAIKAAILLAKTADGSCMMVVITDAPIDSRNLERVAKRAMMGLAKTGGIASNGSGDYVIALSVAPENLLKDGKKMHTQTVLDNGEMSSIFAATIEATAEALWNSMFMATTTKGYKGKVVEALPVEKVLEMLRDRNK